jgi:hypothetical protein
MMHKTTRVTSGLNRKMFCRSRYDTHKIKIMNSVKVKKPDTKMCAGLDVSPGSGMCATAETAEREHTQYTKILATKLNVFKIECCINYG